MIQLQWNNLFFWRGQLLCYRHDDNFILSSQHFDPKWSSFHHSLKPSLHPVGKIWSAFGQLNIWYKLTQWNWLPEKYFPLFLLQPWPIAHPIHSLWDPVTHLTGITDRNNILQPYEEPSSGSGAGPALKGFGLWGLWLLKQLGLTHNGAKVKTCDVSLLRSVCLLVWYVLKGWYAEWW